MFYWSAPTRMLTASAVLALLWALAYWAMGYA